MPYFIRTGPGLADPQTWHITDTEAVNVAVVNPRSGAGSYFKARDGETIWQAIRRDAPGWFGPSGESPFTETHLQMGEWYPRMARPRDYNPNEMLGYGPQTVADRDALAVSLGQLVALLDMQDRICRTVQPAGANLNAYGHEIRNALLLACMEVETHWRGVLKANLIEDAQLTTNTYVQLASAMRLPEYAVQFPAYPWLPAFAPYRGWVGAKPSQELPWYEAHHKIKHDRESNFSRGTLQHLFTAVAGCIVMLGAQFGDFRLFMEADLMRRFTLTAWAKWPLAECYVVPRAALGVGWTKKPYPFKLPPKRPRSVRDKGQLSSP